MSYAGPRGDKHYRLYEIPSHPFIPPFVSDPGRGRRNKGERDGAEVEAVERERERERERETQPIEPKRKARSASLLKQLRPGAIHCAGSAAKARPGRGGKGKA